MTKLSDHQSQEFVKLLYIGPSGTGKTGSLTSLVKAGYKLRIIDIDNGLDVLRQFIMHECPERIDQVDFETRYDEFKATAAGPVVRGMPKAFVEILKLLTEWPDETEPDSWGPDTVLVIDSFDQLGKQAFEWARGMSPTAKDARQWYHQGQQALENVLNMLKSEGFRTNVIVISHVRYVEDAQGVTKGWPAALGSALGPNIPTYFNTLVLAESSGSGKNVRRTIKTVPTSTIDLKNPAPFKIDEVLPLETGLATLFEQLKEI